MSETAQTLIKAALRAIGAIATGETPSADEMADGLESLKFMLRHWADKDIMIPYQSQDSATMTGAQSYTIGSGGDFNTARPVSILGGYVRDLSGYDHPVKTIDADRYRSLRLKNMGGTCEYLWYSPEYPLGKIYVYPTGGSTLYIDSLKPLTEPSMLTSNIEFPPGYDEAIKWNLAVRMAPEYGKDASETVLALATSAYEYIEARNFAGQVSAVSLKII